MTILARTAFCGYPVVGPTPASGALSIAIHWGDLLTIYARQVAENQQLSLNAPTLGWVIQTIRPGSFQTLFHPALVLAVIVSLAMVGAFVSRGSGVSPKALVLMATLTLVVVPYVLPKMHKRYFFAAGAMAFVLAVASPRTWPIVALIQAANLCAYTRYLMHWSLHWIHYGVVLMTLAIGLLFWQFASENSRLSPEPPAGPPAVG